MNYILSLLISSVLGFLLVNLLRARERIDPLIHLIASVAIGVALSAQIGFYTLFTFSHYSTTAVAIGHIALFLLLAAGNMYTFRKNREDLMPKFPPDRTAWIGFGILSLLLIPLWREAHFFPFGGWDAWACWNLKAKFIFLGGDAWKNMLDVSMWRSNNQYPFLLPLINVWGWSFYGNPSVSVPLANTVLFPFLTALIMFWGIKRRVKSLLSIVPPLVFFTIPFVNTLSISQYSDIVVACYLLGSFVCLNAAREEESVTLATIAGLLCGIMTFTKSEGCIAAVLICALAVPYFWRRGKGPWTLLGPFLAAAIVSALPAILFQLFWATPNVSFVNGLTSADHPANVMRLKAIFMFIAVELISPKWNGLWILLAGGLILGRMRGFTKNLAVVPIFLSVYLGGAVLHYYVNTHYEIVWWLGTTLNRIVYTILPLIVWWSFAAAWGPSDKSSKA